MTKVHSVYILRFFVFLFFLDKVCPDVSFSMSFEMKSYFRYRTNTCFWIRVHSQYFLHGLTQVTFWLQMSGAHMQMISSDILWLLVVYFSLILFVILYWAEGRSCSDQNHPCNLDCCGQICVWRMVTKPSAVLYDSKRLFSFCGSNPALSMDDKVVLMQLLLSILWPAFPS